MKISLRKAKALQTEIKHKLDEIIPKGTTKIDEFSVITQINEAAEDFGEKLTLSLQLIEALYEVRELSAIENVQCGISLQLTCLAEVEAKLSLLRGVDASKAMEAEGLINAKLRRLAEGIQGEYGNVQKSMMVGVVIRTKEIERDISALKKGRVNILDKLAELNAFNFITLSATSRIALEEADII